MTWWGVWCALLVAGARAAPAPGPLPPLDLAQIDPPAPDDEGSNYAVSPERFEASPPWLYLLADLPRDAQSFPRSLERRTRPKRKMPSLSINNPMEVLRQRLILEVARKQLREASQRQAFANRLFLQNVGKRGYWADSVSSQYHN